jgi:hypothetical protein
MNVLTVNGLHGINQNMRKRRRKMGDRYKVFSSVVEPAEIGLFIKEKAEKHKACEVVACDTIKVDNGILVTLVLDNKVEASMGMMDEMLDALGEEEDEEELG